MPRRGFVPKREVLDDPIYGGKLVTKLINQVMLDGKRGTAQKACYGAFDIIREKTGREPLEVFQEAMNNVMPVLEVKARRIGGSTYQVPLEIRAERRQTLCAGSCFMHAQGASAPCRKGSPAKFLMLAISRAPLSKRKRMFTRWQKRTRLSHTSGSDFPFSETSKPLPFFGFRLKIQKLHKLISKIFNNAERRIRQCLAKHPLR